jgi:hypothetical protein
MPKNPQYFFWGNCVSTFFIPIVILFWKFRICVFIPVFEKSLLTPVLHNRYLSADLMIKKGNNVLVNNRKDETTLYLSRNLLPAHHQAPEQPESNENNKPIQSTASRTGSSETVHRHVMSGVRE